VKVTLGFSNWVQGIHFRRRQTNGKEEEKSKPWTGSTN